MEEVTIAQFLSLPSLCYQIIAPDRLLSVLRLLYTTATPEERVLPRKMVQVRPAWSVSVIALLLSTPAAFRPHIRFVSTSTRRVQSMNMGSDLGLVCRPSDFGLKSIGMPRVMEPGEQGTDWLVWFHGRTHEQSEDDLVNLSTGNVYFAVSRDGISDWTLQEDNPVLIPGKVDGDWWWFDSEHVGIGHVINPGVTAQSKFITQQGVFLAYFFGGNSNSVSVDTYDSDNAKSQTRNIKGVKMEIGLAVSQDGAHWSKVEGEGAYSAILEVGKEGEFDNQFVGWPFVLEDEVNVDSYYFLVDLPDSNHAISNK